MANDEHVALLKQGKDAWNAWRDENPNIVAPDLREAQLIEGYLREANLFRADLSGANLFEADLSDANLSGAILTDATLTRAKLAGATLTRANLSGANLSGAILSVATLTRAKLIGANLWGAHLNVAKLCKADLTGADLYLANLHGAVLNEAILTGANLRLATLVNANLTGADLTGCQIHGVSAWGLKLDKAKQQNLIITGPDEPTITVDNIEVAQFIYLLLNNPKIRDVIDTIGRKAVLILGRFTPVLDALREELRKRDYLPILFDFDKPASQDLTATVSTLAHLARFIIADLSDPSSIPYELATVVPTTPVPVQPILLSGCSEFAMFQDLRRRHHWVLPTHRYVSQEQLLADLGEKVIRSAELKVLDLRAST